MKNKRHFFRIALCGLISFLISPITTHSQTFLSEIWTGTGGNNLAFSNAIAKTDAGRNVYMLTSTINISNNHDFLLQKRDPNGSLLWQQTYNGIGNGEDVPADLFIDQNDDVYVTGTSVQNSNDGQDLIVIKYSSGGTINWTYFYNNSGSPLPDDAGTSIVVENNDVFVTGASAGNSTLSDYVTIKLDASSGSSQWVSRYDYLSLQEVPNKIIVNGSDIVITGASQITASPIRYELATITYDINTGNQIDERRSSGNAVNGVNEIYDLARDNSGNIYLTGATDNTTTGMDQSVYKLDSQLNIVWEQHFDANGFDDKGKGIKVDSQGNVYSVGYVSTSNEGKNFSILKYNSLGVLQWSREFDGRAHLDDEAAQLWIDANDNVFISGHSVDQTHSNFSTVGYKPNGSIYCQVQYDSPYGLNDIVSSLTADLDGNIIVVGQSQLPNGSFKAQSVKYSIMTKDSSIVIPFEGPSYRDNEVIIKFKESELNMLNIDKSTFDAGFLENFVSLTVINEMSTKLSLDAKELHTFKIFHRMTSADSLSISRLGDTIKMDKFYTTLSVFLPQGTDINIALDSINSMNSVLYSEKNIIMKLAGVPNDDLYMLEQTGIHSSMHGINLEDAWDKQTGQDNVKIGVIDTGINWRHEDFGDGTSSGTKIIGGWDFLNNAHPHNQTDPDEGGHGTACAGIIGALRNNNKGVAGVAGGDFSLGNTGVELFSLKISEQVATDVAMTAAAIVEGASYTPNYGYGLHVLNNSYYGEFSQSINNAIRHCYGSGCVFVACSGNSSNDEVHYPATSKKNWVLKVGANDATGARASFSTWGNNLDVIAPGTQDIYETLQYTTNSGYAYPFDGTSFSTPFVSGVAGLLLSEHNITNGYPNNLAPEDIEVFINSFATDVFPIGYDPESGNGRLNADLALEKLSLPVYSIYHRGGYGGNNSSVLIGANDQIVFTNLNHLGFAAGIYFADKYLITNTYLDIFPPNTEILSVWPRLSASRGFTGANPQNAETGLTSFVYNVTNLNVLSVITTSYAYYINSSYTASNINTWVPQHPFDIRTSYSVYLKDNTNFGLDELSNKFDLNLYPNPSESIINLDFNVKGGETFSLIVTDALGKEVAQYENNNLEFGQNKLQINLSNLEDGVYFCNITIGNELLTKKVIIRD